MIRARILRHEQPAQDVKGWSVESIARNHFGRRAEIRQEETTALQPSVVRWTVCVPAAGQVSSWHVLGTIVEYRSADFYEHKHRDNGFGTCNGCGDRLTPEE